MPIETVEGVLEESVECQHCGRMMAEGILIVWVGAVREVSSFQRVVCTGLNGVGT